ncbi:MAG: helix-turn-helix transcriptional regulator [Bacteroidota bacterium]
MEINKYDIIVGRNLRIFRSQAGKTQDEIGEFLGITFQQVQKYERGLNRIGAGRLKDLSEYLERPISSFYDETIELIYEGADNKRYLRLIASVMTLRGRPIFKTLEKLIYQLAEEETVA